MRMQRYTKGVLVSLLLLGCADTGGMDETHSTETVDAGHGDSGTGNTVRAEYPWTETSQRLELRCGAFMMGYMLFRADREQLSGAELAMLRRMETSPGDGECWEDTFICTVTIGETDGNVAEYSVEQNDSLCGREGKMIAYASILPFIDSPIPVHETTPLLRTLTGSLFGLATVWLAYPHIQDAMDDFRSTLHKRFGWE